MEQRMTVTAQRAALMAGPVMVVLLGTGWLLAGFLPAPGPGWSAERIAAKYQDETFRLQIAFFIMVIAASCFGIWGTALTMWMRPTESRFPILTYVQLVLLGAGTAIFVMLYIPWVMAAFRASDWSPEMIQMLHEFGWFMFFFDVAPFCLWMITMGLAVLWTPDEHRILPRWAGYYCMFESLMLAPASLTIFFKEGPFSYNGALTLWVPLISFFFWVTTMTIVGWKAINHQVAADETAGIGVHRDRRELTPTRVQQNGVGPVHTPAQAADDDLVGVS